MKNFVKLLKQEFHQYNGQKFVQDLMAGITVAAVALPLALAFGVSSGADAASGLITAIVSGLVIGALSGASYQISGPTGAMTAILISLVAKFQLQGIFIATFLAGIILILCSVFKIGRLVSIIPSPVITGFTSGIAIIIALGQVDNFFGVTSQGESAIAKLLSYGTLGFNPNMQAVGIAVMVVAIMLIWPKKWGKRFPASLAGIIAAVTLNMIFNFDVAVVGEIPKTLFPENRLNLTAIPFDRFDEFIAPAVSIAALCMIESLLCGASGGRMKGEKLEADQELFAQGVGNMLLPFFGGIPSTAAIARTSVAIKSGCQTRLTSIFHAIGLLISMFALGPVMSKIPLSALAGVLMITAWRMNEFESIKYIFQHRFKTSIAQFLITMIATVVLDLTMAIIVGVVLSAFLFIIRVSDMEISFSEIDREKLDNHGIVMHKDISRIRMVYITGPVFFANIEKLESALYPLENCDAVIFSMRGVPFIDSASAHTLLEVMEYLHDSGIIPLMCAVQPKVKTMLDRADVTKIIGEEHYYWDGQAAILACDNLEHLKPIA